MFDAHSFDPSTALTAFLALPGWAQTVLPLMAAALVLMNSILGSALWSRRKALRKVEELTVDLADVRARLSSETRWRLADQKYNAAAQAAAETTHGHPSALPAV